MSELLELVSSSLDSLSSGVEAEGEVSFRGSCGDEIAGSVFDIVMMVDSSFVVGVNGMDEVLSLLGGSLVIYGSGACREGVLDIFVVVQLESILLENTINRDPSNEETSLLPMTGA